MTQPTTTVRLPQAIVVGDLAEALGVTPVDVIKELMKNGVMATINQVVDFDTAAVVAAGVYWTTRQAKYLLEGGAPGVHFYTLNKSSATLAVHAALGL